MSTQEPTEGGTYAPLLYPPALHKPGTREHAALSAETILLAEEMTAGDAKAALFSVLAKHRLLAGATLQRLRLGRIDGGSYNPRCGCLKGVLAAVLGLPGASALPDVELNPDRPEERIFSHIVPGYTSENNDLARLIALWLQEWIDAHPEAA